LNRRFVVHPAVTALSRDTMLLGLALVVVLLSLLLTILIGEPGVRGVPIRAA
jgi:hypothetical protein